MSTIFTTTEKTAKLKEGSQLSFEGCPNDCIDGYYFDPYKRVRYKCQYCAEKRAQMIKYAQKDETDNKDIYKKLNIPLSFEGLNFDADSFVKEQYKPRLNKQDVEAVTKEVDKLVVDMKAGFLPEYSICFNTGDYVYYNSFIQSYLLSSYKVGLKTAPFITGGEIARLRKKYESGIDFDADLEDTDSNNLTYEELLNVQTLLVFVDKGSQSDAINAVYGVVELRGLKSLPTVIISKIKLYKDSIPDIQSYFDPKTLNLSYDADFVALSPKNSNEVTTKSGVLSKSQLDSILQS